MLLTDTPTSAFADLGLGEAILRAVADSGYTQPTAIQAQAIPHVLARRDVVGVAQTGTGKTASFVLPMLHVLSNGRARARMPRSLILSPTRELATQTSANFEIYGKYLNLSMALLIGGVGMGDQEKALEKGVDVLIATPGRLLDWFERGKVMLGGVQILVIDEADRMLDMGFIPDVERIISLLTRREQTLLFSATMPPAVRRLADRFLSEPATVEVARSATTAEGVEAFLVPVAGEDKRQALLRLIRGQAIGKAIVFCNRKRDVSSLNRFLQTRGLNARDIHGDLEQVHRQATLDAFKADQVDYLIATDVAARGLDISDMPNVVNFDVPFNPEDYVHRVGRTGRAGKTGRAFTFATPEEGKSVAAIERLTNKPIPRLEPDGAKPAAAGAPAAPPVEAAAVADGEERPAAAKPARARRTRSASSTRSKAAEAAPAEPTPAVAVPVETVADAAEPVQAEVVVQAEVAPVTEAAEAPRPRARRRRTRTATPETAQAAASAAEAEPAPVVAAERPVAARPAPARAERPAADGRRRDGDEQRPAARGRGRSPTPPPPPPTTRDRRPGGVVPRTERDDSDRPVLAFGELGIPGFLLRPAPISTRSKVDAEMEAEEAEAV